MWELSLLSLVPLILFVMIDYKAGLKAGIFTAIGTSIGLALIFWYLLGELDLDLIFMVVAIAVTGLISIRKKNSIFFEFQPVVTNMVGVLFIGWYQFFDTPIMVKYLPKMERFFSPEQAELLARPEVRIMLERLSLFVMVLMVVHSLIIAFAALRMKNKYWLLAKALGAPFVVVGALALELVWRGL